jgi:hypothetical protein
MTQALLRLGTRKSALPKIDVEALFCPSYWRMAGGEDRW